MDSIKKEMEGFTLTPKFEITKCECDSKQYGITDLKTDSEEMDIGLRFYLADRSIIECICKVSMHFFLAFQRIISHSNPFINIRC